MEDVSELEHAKKTLRMIETEGIDTSRSTSMIAEYVLEHEAEDAIFWKEKKPIKDPSNPRYNPYFLPMKKQGATVCCPIS